ncbi:MAG: HD-GYP domain-containing protein [Pyrinomonadaceae bacterium]
MLSSAATDIEISDAILNRSAEMDNFEGYAGPHGAVVARIADALALRFNLARHDRSTLVHAAYLHDVGEVAMKREYIASSQVLSAEERLDLQRHPVIGEQEAARMGLARGTQLLIRWHHEWWNGLGYPDGLVAGEIPLTARILRVADTFASLTATRPFRAAMPAADARKYLIEWAGIEFDPKVVKAFIELESERDAGSTAGGGVENA